MPHDQRPFLVGDPHEPAPAPRHSTLRSDGAVIFIAAAIASLLDELHTFLPAAVHWPLFVLAAVATWRARR